MHDHRCRWCRVTIADAAGTALVKLDLGGRRRPGVEVVDLVAQLVLWGRRLGAQVTVSHVSDRMAELLGLAALPVEVQRQAEGGKEPLGVEEVEEEAHVGDLPL